MRERPRPVGQNQGLPRPLGRGDKTPSAGRTLTSPTNSWGPDGAPWGLDEKFPKNQGGGAFVHGDRAASSYLITPNNAPERGRNQRDECIYLDVATTIFFGADGVEALASAFRRGARYVCAGEACDCYAACCTISANFLRA
jgi:hypothetical protein